MAEKHGYESTPVSEVRKELYLYNVEKSWVDTSSKTELVKKLLELKEKNKQMEENPLEVLLDAAVDNNPFSDEKDFDIPEDIPQVRPPFNSDKWSEYVLNQFNEDELVEGNPTCDGCRRLVQELIGPIIEKSIPKFSSPSEGNNDTATVLTRVVINVTNEEHPSFGETILIEEIADCNKFNTPSPYNKHKSATASTMSEGRAYRKLLGLKKVMVAEEAVTNQVTEQESSWNPNTVITTSQINLLDILCARLNIDVIGFINSGDNKYDDIHLVPEDKAAQMLQFLNAIQQNQKQKPVTVGDYNPNWQQKG